jgi:Kdo2-lipid IVA lauroyltransferase/acyltransferase
MNSLKKSFLFASVKIAAFLFMLLPIGVSLWLGRCLGLIGYHFLYKKRRVVYANLKTVFAAERSPSQIQALTRQVFMNFVQSAVEFICLPKIKRLGFDKFVDLQDMENIDRASALGKGVILLAFHSGSWELASVVGGVTKRTYHVVANDQSKIPQLDTMLNEYRSIAGAHVITAGIATKGIIKVIRDNEIVSLVLDQGGKTGVVVPFLGKTASMSTGAIRLALKYGCAVCPVWIERGSDGKHTLRYFPAMSLITTGDIEKDISVNVAKAANHFERLLREHPADYMWFYKVFKYSNQSRILIVDDGRTGHLRQSQALSQHLREVLKKKGKSVEENVLSLKWRGPSAISCFSFYVFLAQYLVFLRREDCLRFFLTDVSFNDVMKYKADFVISCGSQGAGINFILSQNHLAKSISILTPGLVSQERFTMVVLPEHDKPRIPQRARMVIPKVSPNLINASYLKEQSEGLIKYYSHLKGSVRTKFGVLIGGNANGVKFDEAQIRELIDQIKEAAVHYNADILLTTSRRTPVEIEQLIAKELKNFERCSLCIIANQRNIPEAVGGILGLSDLVIVSGESISMVSEALSSGRRTIVFSPHGQYRDKPRDKYEDFVLKLNDQGYLMVTSVYDMKAKITQLLSRKITLKTLDDQRIIQSGLEAIV